MTVVKLATSDSSDLYGNSATTKMKKKERKKVDDGGYQFSIEYCVP